MNSCNYCGKSTRNAKFCSIKCQAQLSSKVALEKRTNAILNGEYVHPRGYREYLFSTRERVCSICRSTDWLGQPIPLVVDHIDGNSDNNHLVNLRLICNNCDATLPTYKARNYGNGRAKRRARYLEGKSY